MSIQEGETDIFPWPGGGGRSFGLRLCAVLVGYLVALGGALSTFSVPLYVTPLVMAGGMIIAWLGSRGLPKPTPPNKMTWREWTIYLAGYLVIIGVLSLFGDERIRQWRPHPAGYILAWISCFHAVRHVRYLMQRHRLEMDHDA